MQVADVSVGQLIVAGGMGAMAIMQGLILSKLNKVDTVSERVTNIDAWAFGPNRDNGANGDIKALKSDVAQLQKRPYPVFTRRESDTP